MIHPGGEEGKPMKFIISETDEILVSHSGLGLAGALLQGTGIQKRSNAIRLGDRKRPEVSHGDVLTVDDRPAVPGQARLRGHRGVPRRRLLSAGPGPDERSPRRERCANDWTNWSTAATPSSGRSRRRWSPATPPS